MMQQRAVVALAAFALSQSAYGADLSVKAFDAPATYDWTGYYTGAHLDYQAGQSRWSESRFGALGATGVFDVGKGYDFSSGTGSYAKGFQGRYDYMAASHHVFGVEGDIWFPNTVSGKQTFATAAAGSGTYSETVQFSGTLRGRL
jgi:high affinity Mn2+ porin